MSHFYKVGGGGEEGHHLSEDPELEKVSTDNSVDLFLLCYIVVKDNSKVFGLSVYCGYPRS